MTNISYICIKRNISILYFYQWKKKNLSHLVKDIYQAKGDTTNEYVFTVLKLV